jgi:laminin alpha 1/2
LGNLLTNYGSQFQFQVDFVIVRGDTSGKATNSPNFILIGANGMKIAFGDGNFTNSNASVNVPLMEHDWYHVPKNVNDITTSRYRRTNYRGDFVTRNQFMEVLRDVKNILIRGTFHTDQAEASLKRARLIQGGVNEKIEENFNFVEKCECPKSHSGLSCESCMFGFMEIEENSSTHEKIIKCMECDCNGHAEACDVTGNLCGKCLHNTHGEK